VLTRLSGHSEYRNEDEFWKATRRSKEQTDIVKVRRGSNWLIVYNIMRGIETSSSFILYFGSNKTPVTKFGGKARVNLSL
jgi:hypothetical protein